MARARVLHCCGHSAGQACPMPAGRRQCLTRPPCPRWPAARRAAHRAAVDGGPHLAGGRGLPLHGAQRRSRLPGAPGGRRAVDPHTPGVPLATRPSCIRHRSRRPPASLPPPAPRPPRRYRRLPLATPLPRPPGLPPSAQGLCALAVRPRGAAHHAGALDGAGVQGRPRPAGQALRLPLGLCGRHRRAGGVPALHGGAHGPRG